MFHHGQEVAGFCSEIKVNFIHSLPDKKKSQTVGMPFLQWSIQIGWAYFSRVERFSPIVQDNRQFIRPDFTGAFNIPHIFFPVGVLDDIGAGFFNRCFDLVG